MSGFFSRIARLATFGKTKRLVGRDLEGNKYFELPPVNGGRTKRVVEYKVERDIADYTNGINRLPIQWTTWLSHTRADPPSLAELQTDYSRQERLQPMIAAIEEREREERIRQGYLAAPGQEGGAVGQIAGPSSSASGYQEGKHSGMRYHLGSSGSAAGGTGSRINAPPSFAPPGAMSESASPSTSAAGETSAGGNDRHVDWQAIPAARWAYPTSTSSRPDAPTTTSQNAAPQQPYTVPTPTSSHVPPPAQSVDPSKYDDPATLRRLAEEDTKRRMQSADVPTPPSVGPAAQSSRIKPRRRGGAQ